MKTPSFSSTRRPQLMGAGHESRIHIALNSRLHQFAAAHLEYSGHAVFPKSAPHGAYLSEEAAAWMETNRESLLADVAEKYDAARAAQKAERAACAERDAAEAVAESARLATIGAAGQEWEAQLARLEIRYESIMDRLGMTQCLRERASKPSKVARHRALIADVIIKLEAACSDLKKVTGFITEMLQQKPHSLCRLPHRLGHPNFIKKSVENNVYLWETTSRIIDRVKSELYDARAYAFPEPPSTHPAL